MKKSWIVILIFAILIMGVIFGITIYSNNKKDIANRNIVENNIEKISEEIIDDCTDEWESIQKEARLDLEVNANEQKISPNCRITLQRHYNECGHTVNEYIDIPEKLVNQSKEELQEEYQNWEIQKYSSTDIVLYKEFDSSCGQHYILREDNGKITVYTINEEEQEEVFDKTEISVDYLPETDKIEIENGIRVYGKENLNKLLENYE